MSNLGGVPHDGEGPASLHSYIEEHWPDCITFEPMRKAGEELREKMAGQENIFKKTPDKINPSHYCADGIECHSVQRAVLGPDGMRSYWHGCAIKYLFRSLRKNGPEDIRKAIRCLQFYLDEKDGKAQADG